MESKASSIRNANAWGTILPPRATPIKQSVSTAADKKAKQLRDRIEDIREAARIEREYSLGGLL